MLRISGDVRDPLFRAPRRRLGAPPTGCPLVQCQIAAHERERHRGLVTRQNHVESLDPECSASALSVIGDTNGRPDTIAVTEREYRDHQSARKVDLVVERSDERVPLLGERGPGREGVHCKGGSVTEQPVQDLFRDEAATSGGVEGVESGENHDAVGIGECRLDDPEAVRRRSGGCGPDERCRPRDAVACQRGS